ncbi:MAG: DNA mismatch repair protein MutS [Halobacteriales archaeon]
MRRADGIVGEFFALKEEADADILAMQVGDFYEFFADDAETVARELDLKISQKSSHGSSYPMAGVPVDELTPYLKALVERGYRVAVADQRDPDADGEIDREITRIVTPGTLLETTDADAQYLATVVDDGDRYGIAFTDITTGRFLVTTVETIADVLSECYRFDPVELLPGPSLREDATAMERFEEATSATVTDHDADAFARGAATHTVTAQFGSDTAESLGLSTVAIRAAGGALDYVESTGAAVQQAITRLSPYRADDHVALDATTQRNLELTETLQGDHAGTLFATIDETVTSAGGRQLKEWLGRPRRDIDVLERRQDAVAVLTDAALARERIRETLDDAYDLARLTSKASHGSADARDLTAVRDTLALVPDLVDAIEGSPALADSALSTIVAEIDHDRAATIREELTTALVEEPPGTVTEGGLFQQGYDDELDAIIAEYEEAMTWIDSLADREKQRLGITHLQVDRNTTDGYYIQIGKSEADQVPEEYREIKTLKNSRRFTTDELEDRERTILRLEERRSELEYELFVELRDRLAGAAEALQTIGRTLARVDALTSLATHAVENGWTKPAFGTDGITIETGRHPVVEQTTEFVPNDTQLDADRRFQIVTGPNMSGKSTYMRQVALITLLAQIGSFVPADRAEIEPVDGIYTRVGALDELAQGRSTFMVEMQELSNILHSATDDSLVILDEVGRGTATYDGISIAWAATEQLATQIRATTLFATHYHELTQLADHIDGVHNVHVAAEERDGDVTFLRTVEDGPTDRSYGIHVAELAGVPAPVVDRARDVLARLREDKAIDVRGGESGTQQVVFDLGTGEFRGSASADGGDTEPRDPATASVLEELDDLDVTDTSPLELMSLIQEWQDRLGDRPSE